MEEVNNKEVMILDMKTGTTWMFDDDKKGVIILRKLGFNDKYLEILCSQLKYFTDEGSSTLGKIILFNKYLVNEKFSWEDMYRSEAYGALVEYCTTNDIELEEVPVDDWDIYEKILTDCELRNAGMYLIEQCKKVGRFEFNERVGKKLF